METTQTFDTPGTRKSSHNKNKDKASPFVFIESDFYYGMLPPVFVDSSLGKISLDLLTMAPQRRSSSFISTIP